MSPRDHLVGLPKAASLADPTMPVHDLYDEIGGIIYDLATRQAAMKQYRLVMRNATVGQLSTLRAARAGSHFRWLPGASTFLESTSRRRCSTGSQPY